LTKQADATPSGEIQEISYSWIVVPFAVGVSFVSAWVGLADLGGGPLGLIVGIDDEDGVDAGVAAWEVACETGPAPHPGEQEHTQ